MTSIPATVWVDALREAARRLGGNISFSNIPNPFKKGADRRVLRFAYQISGEETFAQCELEVSELHAPTDLVQCAVEMLRAAYRATDPSAPRTMIGDTSGRMRAIALD